MTATAWTNQTGNATFFGLVSNMTYNESGRTYNASEQSSSSAKHYYDGLTPTQYNVLVPSSTAWTAT